MLKSKKKIRRKETIINPQEYIDILGEHGTVLKLGENGCNVRDWKTEVLQYFKPPAQWHFKFNSAKRFIITRSKMNTPMIRGEYSYNSDLGKAYPVLKKLKKISAMNPKNVQYGFPVKTEKKKDVNNLLSKHFGESWKEMEQLNFYKEVLDTDEYLEVAEDSICENRADDIYLVV